MVLKLFQTMVQTNDFSIENAGMVIASKFKESAFSNGTGSVPSRKERIRSHVHIGKNKKDPDRYFDRSG
ncbi:hypothetical protein ACFOU2_14395 [Bacillus songklensis]|uniref:Uncharacterized protein n=1 Tax=Bacillus songklensis TaxID=1069116 RepID=A0ABV8B4N2_9BACI